MQQHADKLVEFDVPSTQAKGHATVLVDILLEMVTQLTEVFVTRDYLDARFAEQNRYMDSRFHEIDQRFAAIDSRFVDQRAYMDDRFSRLEGRMSHLFWMVGLGFSVLIIPQLRVLLGG